MLHPEHAEQCATLSSGCLCVFTIIHVAFCLLRPKYRSQPAFIICVAFCLYFFTQKQQKWEIDEHRQKRDDAKTKIEKRQL